MARKPIAPGANGRRNSSIASAWVRAGGAGGGFGGAGTGVGMVAPFGWVGAGGGGLRGLGWVGGGQAGSACGFSIGPAPRRKRDGPALRRPLRVAAWVSTSRSLA